MAKEITIHDAPETNLGQYGFDEITAVTTGDWIALMAVGGSATLVAVTDEGDNLSSLTISEGVIIPGTFNSITPSAGTILAFRRNPDA